jgi:hypothetical protein
MKSFIRFLVKKYMKGWHIAKNPIRKKKEGVQ